VGKIEKKEENWPRGETLNAYASGAATSSLSGGVVLARRGLVQAGEKGRGVSGGALRQEKEMVLKKRTHRGGAASESSLGDHV